MVFVFMMGLGLVIESSDWVGVVLVVSNRVLIIDF